MFNGRIRSPWLLLPLLLLGCNAPSSTPTPSASPSGSAEPTPSSAPSASFDGRTFVRGKVYDDQRDPVPSGTQLTIRSLNPSQPYEVKTTVEGGVYALPDVPINVQLEIAVGRPGWTIRKRVVVLSANPKNLASRNVYNFGGTDEDVDPLGRAYFISNRPEVESITPADAATSLSSDELNVTIRLSEPLDETNRRRFAAALTIVPNNAEALGAGQSFPNPVTADVELSGFALGADVNTTAPYKLQQNASYLSGFANAELTWDSAFQTATLRLKAPLKTDADQEAQYAVCFVQADDEPIVDPEGLAMGMATSADFQTNTFGGTSQGTLLRNLIAPQGFNLGAAENLTEESRWAATHVSFSKFAVKQDTQAPSLSKVVGRRGFTDESGVPYDRVELTFSKPMVAYPQLGAKALLSLNNYIITTAETQALVDSHALVADSGVKIVGAGSGLAGVQSAMEASRGMTVASDAASLTTEFGTFAVFLSPNNPQTVILRYPAGSLPLSAGYLRVLPATDDYVSGGASGAYEDSAGNALEAGQGVSGSIL